MKQQETDIIVVFSGFIVTLETWTSDAINNDEKLVLDSGVASSCVSVERGGLAYSSRQIAHRIGCSQSAVVKTVQKKRITGSVVDRARSGRPSASTSRQDRTLCRICLINRKLMWQGGPLPIKSPFRYVPYECTSTAKTI